MDGWKPHCEIERYKIAMTRNIVTTVVFSRLYTVSRRAHLSNYEKNTNKYYNYSPNDLFATFKFDKQYYFGIPLRESQK